MLCVQQRNRRHLSHYERLQRIASSIHSCDDYIGFVYNNPMGLGLVADEVLRLLESAKGQRYMGESVTQLEHALQCAQLARDAKADRDTILAALLHDVGHICQPSTDHELAGAKYLRERGFSEALVALAEGHVAAKRYLTATNPSYYSQLSETSKKTLELQGGPMTPAEVAAFECDPLFKEKLRLRSWDEGAKIPGLLVTSLEFYRPAIIEHLERARKLRF
jgi:2-amino-1-hydroxyethylphosphonate dioxygenase (glycine-forming)